MTGRKCDHRKTGAGYPSAVTNLASGTIRALFSEVEPAIQNQLLAKKTGASASRVLAGTNSVCYNA
jgi:hypothetical protein